MGTCFASLTRLPQWGQALGSNVLSHCAAHHTQVVGYTASDLSVPKEMLLDYFFISQDRPSSILMLETLVALAKPFLTVMLAHLHCL